ncbi:MAG: hypothetical protein J7578_19880 [Chitinophagaceae bacterium]|nr:hypothetical protein [Chitinophagaceae bacterium]
MSKPVNNPLDLLNLAGQRQLETKIISEEFKGIAMAEIAAETPPPATLGNLAKLPGTWVGTGFNIIELPNMNQAMPGPPPPDKFRVMTNATSETLIFSPISGDIINRGNAQGDIAYLGLHYLQQVSDVNLPKDNNGIHLETGLFLNLVGSTDPGETPTIARLGSIPHGDSILAQGQSFTLQGGPTFDTIDTTPFQIINGKRENDTSANYLAILNNAVPPPNIPAAAIKNPNIILENAISGQKILETVVILLDANPMDGVSNVPPFVQVGGITNIPFINVNANAVTLSAIFWIETVQNPDNSTFLQLQYSQTVILDFPVFGPPPDNQLVNLKWPHVSVATLRLQP